MKEEIIIAGSGGQGIVLAGSLLANVAMEDNLETCGMVSYGAEMRGGTAHSSIIISDKKISSPVIVKPDTLIIMNKPSLDKFEKKIKIGGLIILNTSECKEKVKRTDVKVIEIKATEIAKEMGNIKIANLILIGAYIKNQQRIKIDSAVKVLEYVLPKSKHNLLEINKKALMKGYGEI